MTLKPGFKEWVSGHMVMVKLGSSTHRIVERAVALESEAVGDSNLALPPLSLVLLCEDKTMFFPNVW